MENKKNNRNNLILVIVTFIIFLSIQYLIPIQFGNRSIFIFAIEFITFFFFLFSILIKFFKRKKIFNINKKNIILLLGFFAWFIILTIYRYIIYKDITGAFIIFRVTSLPLVLILLCYEYRASSKSILSGLLFFISFLNIEQVYSLIFLTKNFRTMIGLQNINIYLCFAISSMPLLILLKEKTVKNKALKIFKIIVVDLNLLVITIFSTFSGSRLAFVMSPFVLTVSYFLINKIKTKSIFKYISFVMLSFLIILSLCHFNVYDSKNNLERSVLPIIKILNIEKELNDENNTLEKEEIKVESEENNSNNIENIEKELNDGNNIVEIKEEFEENNSNNIKKEKINSIKQETNIVESNSMRKLLWEKSIYYIRKNPIFGKSNIDIEIDMNFVGAKETTKVVQSPHNFILELWIALGLPGLIYYFIILLIAITKLIKSKVNLSLKFNCLLSLISIYTFSFFQPLVTCYFAISILLVCNFYIYLYEEE